MLRRLRSSNRQRKEDMDVVPKLDRGVRICRSADAVSGQRPGGRRREVPHWPFQLDPINPRLGGQAIKFDPTKAWGPAQEAPLTAEYQKVHEESMADQANGGLGNYPTATCHPGGMPRIMSIGEYEYIVEPETTYILIGGEDHYRRIFTDERPWPTDIEPSYAGYSIGNWIDEDGDGRFNVLEV